jgi:chemotaxis protein CheX
MMTSRELDLEEITRTIWATFFANPIERGDGSMVGVESTVTSIVHIEGAWHGAVILRCPRELAARLTAEMLGSESAPTLDDIRDALGELTNMVAGNLKALLPEPSTISLPAVILGSDYELGVLGTTIVATVPFACNGSPLVVMLVERSALNGGTGR